MELTGADLDRIPRTNLRVPLLDFARFWVDVEIYQDTQRDRRVVDWYGAGVRATCQWLGRAIIRPSDGGRPYPARSPVTGSQRWAYEELIEAEYLAAELLDMRRPRPRWLLDQPGWSEGILATLAWAWRGTAPAPVLGARESRAAG